MPFRKAVLSMPMRYLLGLVCIVIVGCFSPLRRVEESIPLPPPVQDTPETNDFWDKLLSADQETLYKLVAGVGVVSIGFTIVAFFIWGAITKGPLLRAPQTLSWLFAGLLSCSAIAFIGTHLLWVIIPALIGAVVWAARRAYKNRKQLKF